MSKESVRLLGQQMLEAVKLYVARATAQLALRVEELEKKPVAARDISAVTVEGTRGEKGDPGVAGERGEQGPKGEPGERGEKGDPGEAGERGEKGDPGEAGERGEKGDPGEAGATGKPGIQGAQGDPGTPGAQGTPGERGEQGERGVQGERGAQGDPGTPGEQGTPGERGEQGERGAQGDPGTPGEQGTPGERGEQGERGVAGERGAQGDPGTPGAQGTPGERGAQGEKGLPGDPGAVGRDGRDGKDGAPGANGRDAIELDILPAIDEEKSYPRGTYANYRNGTIRSFKNTQTLSATAGDLEKSGWAVMMEGIFDIDEIEHDEGRVREQVVTFTSGRRISKRFITSVCIYRGVWKEGTYQRGDEVTRDGSRWHCMAPSTKAVPRSSGDIDWRLSVKGGADGKSGKDGPPGPPGPPGRSGKDLTQLSPDGRKF